jgi:hypothetical protein
MSDEAPDYTDRVTFRYNVPPKGDHRIEVCMRYKEAHLDFGFDDTEEGNRDASRLFEAYPEIMAHIANEIEVRREVEELDQDLLDLLGEEEQ